MKTLLAFTISLTALILGLVAPAEAQVPFTGTYQAHDDTAWLVADTCRLSAKIHGWEPEGAEPRPVFVWVPGTGAEGEWTGNELTKPFALNEAKSAVAAAAERGFNAYYTIYRGRNTIGSDYGTDLQTACIFNRTKPSTSALDVICGRPGSDCSRVVVAGHSQGGMIALRAANHWGGVVAAHPTAAYSFGCANNPPFWTSREHTVTWTGWDGITRTAQGQRALPDTAVRITNGARDMTNNWVPCRVPGDYSALRAFTGLNCQDPPKPEGDPRDDPAVDCTRADGSGWRIVRHTSPPQGPTDGYADHCYFAVNGYGCQEPQPTDSYWLDGEAAWTLKSALEWSQGRVN